jgi:LemA protein
MLFLAILIALLFGIAMYFIIIYNNLISLKNTVSKNWANIDVLLKQRYSELPKLIDAAKEYMQYERGTFEKIVEARKAAVTAVDAKDLVALSEAESTLKSNLTKLFALAENYPDLKTNEAFHRLQVRISDLETEIADRRELYNDSVYRNNIRINQFPDLIVARIFHFGSFQLLKFEPSEIEDVSVGQQFKTS